MYWCGLVLDWRPDPPLLPLPVHLPSRCQPPYRVRQTHTNTWTHQSPRPHSFPAFHNLFFGSAECLQNILFLPHDSWVCGVIGVTSNIHSTSCCTMYNHLPRFTKSDDTMIRGYLFVVILQTLVWIPLCSLSTNSCMAISPYRFTESDEPVWRGYLYVVILQTLVWIPLCSLSTNSVWPSLPIGLQSPMSLCGGDTSM